jgi:hypothetical protein
MHKNKDIDPLELLFKNYHDYALPVEKNVEFQRKLSSISKKDSFITKEHPEIFNTDQGSQYTSEIHTKRLKDLGITISTQLSASSISMRCSSGIIGILGLYNLTTSSEAMPTATDTQK